MDTAPIGPPVFEEPTASLWQRRAVSIPGLIAGTHTALAMTPAVLPLALLRDRLRQDEGHSTARAWAALLGALMVHEYGLAKLAWTGLKLRGDDPFIALARGRASYDVEMKLAEMLVEMLVRVYRVNIVIEGEEAIGPDPNIILARHSSLFDPVLLMAIAARSRMRIRYVSKRELLWDPCIDVVGHRYPIAFVTRGGKAHAEDLQSVEHLTDALGRREAVLVFPEGTRFSPRKKQRALDQLRVKHPERADWAERWPGLMPPRTGGVLSLLAHDPDDDVLICAHAGLEGISHSRDILDGALLDRTLRFKFWRVRRADIPEDEAGRIRWLYEVFDEISAFVEAAELGD